MKFYGKKKKKLVEEDDYLPPKQLKKQNLIVITSQGQPNIIKYTNSFTNLKLAI